MLKGYPGSSEEYSLRVFRQGYRVPDLALRQRLAGGTAQAWIRLIGAVGIAAEDKRSMRSLNSNRFEFPGPFKEGEYSKKICGEGVFANQPLRFIGPRYDPAHGTLAECKCIDGNSEKSVFCFPLLDLETAP